MMRRSFALVGVAFAVVGIALSVSLVPSQTEAADATFVIPVNDGYGVAACADTDAACGKVVADAWCEAQGFRRSASVGPADVDTTGSIQPSRRRMAVTCTP